MLDDIKPVSGRKGGKGGGSSRTPYEAPDNLLTDSTAYLIDVVSEGEIEGWADADNPGTCIYFDDTPLQNADGSFNFEGVEYWLRTGTPDQEPVPGFSAVENEVGVSVVVEQQQPVARSITATDVDAVRVKVGVASLSTLNTENGDLTEATVDFAIEMQAGAGGWEAVGTHTINGKTTSGYQRAYRVELPEVRPVSIRVRRITEDSDSSNIQDDLYFISYTEVIDAKLRYPDTAYVALAVPASAFGGRVPRRSYRLKGVKCWVPSNYDPVARTYDESTIWDGTFIRAFTSNPAFLTYTVLIEDRWGLGERIAPELVDKWRIYQIGKYCDELVPDGQDGMEPRFTMNGVMNTREAAYQVITQLSAAFRGVTYWGAGAVVPVQDAPADPVKIVTNANVVDGAFNYAGTGLSARKTAVVASYRHPDDHFKVKAGLVFEDHDAIQRYGRRQIDTTLAFTSSRGEALRTAKWIVDTNLTSQETVSYQAGFDHAAIRPGDKLLISDKHRIGFRVGGRITGVAGDRLSVTLDAPVSIEAGESYQLLIATDVGEYLTVNVDTDPGDGITDLGLVSALPVNVMPGAVFVLSATDMEPRLFRVVSNTPEKHLFNIVALEDDADKYARVEQGIFTSDDAPFIIPANDPLSPPEGLTAQAFVRPDPGSLSKLRILASWSSSLSPLVTNYIVHIKEPDAPWRKVGETAEASFEIIPRSDALGEYRVRVRAVSILGEKSPFSVATLQVDDVHPHPPAPDAWVGTPRPGAVLLAGPASAAPDFRFFEIYAATSADPALVHIADVTAPNLVRVVPPGDPYSRYKVRERNWAGLAGDYSDWIAVLPDPVGPDGLAPEVWTAIAEDATGITNSLLGDFQTDVIDPIVASFPALVDGSINTFDATVVDPIRQAIPEIEAEITAIDYDLELVEVGQRSLDTALAQISDHVLWALLHQSQTDSLIRDAGVYVDPDDGLVRISAVESVRDDLGARVSEAEIKVDAQAAAITLRATYSDVEGMLAAAQLNEVDFTAFENLNLRVSTAEADINALEGSITLKADTTVVQGLDARLSTAEVDIDGLEQAITLKVDNTEFTDVETRLSTAEVQLTTLDGPAITQTVADVRYLTDSVAAADAANLEALLDIYRNRDALREDLAYATQDMRALVDEDREAIAELNQSLGAVIDGNSALIGIERTARADADGALATSITALEARAGNSEAAITELNRVEADSGSANARALHQVQLDVEGATDDAAANAFAISGLTTRVTDAEGDLTAQSQQLTDLSSRVTDAETDVSGNATAISGLSTRVTDAEGVLSSHGQDLTQLDARIGTAEGDISGNATALTQLDARVTDAEGDITSQAQQLTNLSSQLTDAEGDITGNATAISGLTTRVTDAEGDITSQAGQITSLSTTVGGHTATINQHSQSINGMELEHTIQLDNNGHISGLVLRSQLDDAGAAVSEAAFLADKFAIVGPGDNPVSPFVVYTSDTNVDGVLVPAGVYMQDATIRRASIGTLEIAGNAVTGTVRAFSNPWPNLIDVTSTAQVDLISVTLERISGYSTDIHFSCNFDAWGNAVPALQVHRSTDGGNTWQQIRYYAAGSSIGGRQTLATFSTVDFNTGSGQTIYKVTASKIDPSLTGGYDANCRFFRLYVSATQFKR
ncbi:TipJ family phage tail tip protein [Thalassovita sp.]|uniref:TipJ family phage tail tip protein n=1 Tax=Thalassovita sp. TaxID=1979401 RepID=UPI003B59BBB1